MQYFLEFNVNNIELTQELANLLNLAIGLKPICFCFEAISFLWKMWTSCVNMDAYNKGEFF